MTDKHFQITLDGFIREIITAFNVSELLERITQYSVQITGADRGAILRVDPISKHTFAQTTHPPNAPIDASLKLLNPGQGIVGWVVNNKETVRLGDATKDPRFAPYFIDTHSELCVPLLDGKNRLLGILNVESTNKHAFSETHQQLLESLANHVVLVLENLESKRQYDSAEAMAMLGDIAGHLIHRANHNVGAIKELAKDIQENSKDLKCKELATEILDIAEQVLQEAQSIRKWGPENSIEPINLHKLVLNALQQMSVPSNIRSCIDVPEDLPHVLANEQRLTEVFVNLIQNAIEAMPDGGEISIRGGYLVEWALVIFQVADTGIGISEDIRSRIFERGFTLKNKQKSGLGFGLWWTQTYIGRLKGKVEVESKQNEWTKFTVSLPMYNSENPAI